MVEQVKVVKHVRRFRTMMCPTGFGITGRAPREKM
jgi:hypothetical protein